MLALMNVPGEEKTIQYTATSVYLAIAGLLFACLFAQNTMPRLDTMRIAYVSTAVIATFVGAAGYFNLFGTAHVFAPLGARTRRIQGPQRVRAVSDLAGAVRARAHDRARRPSRATWSSPVFFCSACC